jgi:hypothetical protein
MPYLQDELHNYMQKEYLYPSVNKLQSLREQRHSVELALGRFVERELISALRENPILREKFVEVGSERPFVSATYIDISFWMRLQAQRDRYSWRLRIALEGGRLLGDVSELAAPQHERDAATITDLELKEIDAILSLFLRKSGIRLMRNKLEESLSFYLGNFKVVTPGSVDDSSLIRAEYRVEKDLVCVNKFVAKGEVRPVKYRIDEDGHLRETAPLVIMTENDKFIPRPKRTQHQLRKA